MTVTPVMLTTRVLCVFAGVIAVLLTAVPKPLRDIDYVIVGAVATFAALLVIFGTIAGDFTRLRTRRRSVLPLDAPPSAGEFDS
jgi:hypothetical protein